MTKKSFSLQKFRSLIPSKRYKSQIFDRPSTTVPSVQICKLCCSELPRLKSDIKSQDENDHVVYLECGKIYAHALCLSDMLEDDICPFCRAEDHEQVSCGNSIEITRSKS